MLRAYFLNGVEDDSILVFRSDDADTLFRIISRLAASRDKEIRGLAKNLEIEWFKRTYNKENNGI
jgi:hypothetical protein